MKIAIVNTLPVPSGNASVNRFLGYGKGLAQKGAVVHVLSSAPFEDSEVDGVQIYSFGRNRLLLKALGTIIRTIRKGHYDAVIIVSNSLLLIYPLWLLCKNKRTKLILEKSEFPFVLLKKGFLNKMAASLYVNTTYRLFDGLIVMTKSLMEYFQGKVRKCCQLFEMPMTVDTDRFDVEKQPSKYGDYIAYCGNMAGNKDGVLNLIEAFDMTSNELKDVSLLLIGGSSSKEDWDKIVAAVSQTGNKHIVMFGKASREQIPGLLKNAKALALARPSGLQSTGGFPTKLGEYLATGNPVIVTAVGDIPHYLDETNSYVVLPNDNKAFAQAILSVFDNYDIAKEIGEKGKELALSVFNSKVQSERLYNYLQSLV